MRIYIKRTFIMLLACIFPLLCACGSDTSAIESTDSLDESLSIFEGLKLAERLDSDWLFLPEEARLLRTNEENDILAASFNGCEAKEITAYAEALFNALTARGCAVYDAMEFSAPKLLEGFEAAELDLEFAGLAYRYYYKAEGKIYMLSVYYYGCAGGTYGNGLTTLRLSDVTESASSLIKE